MHCRVNKQFGIEISVNAYIPFHSLDLSLALCFNYEVGNHVS